MATPDHSPNGRGYKTGLHYFNHDNGRPTDIQPRLHVGVVVVVVVMIMLVLVVASSP